jgi:hypothetical protein
MLGVQGLEGNVVLPSHYEDIYVYGKSPLTFLTRKKNKKYYIVDEHGGEQLLTKDMVLKQFQGITTVSILHFSLKMVCFCHLWIQGILQKLKNGLLIGVTSAWYMM